MRVANLHPATYAERWAIDPPAWEELDDAELVAALDAMPEKADFAERLLRRFLRLCEHPVTRKRMRKTVKSLIEGDNTGRRLFWLVNMVTGRRVLKESETNAAVVLRWQLVGMILAGVAMGRYIRHVEPVCSVDEDQLVAIVTPSIRAALAR